MTEHEPGQDHDTLFRDIEAEFRARPDHQVVETVPPMITMPTELEFAGMRAERETREAAELEKRLADHNEWRAREKLARRRSRLKKALAATTIFLTYKTGGLIDIAGDPFVDAGNVVASAIDKPKVEIPDSLDGVDFEDFAPDTQQDIIAEQEERVEQEGVARDTLISLFSELDKNGPDTLLKEVEEYKQENSQLFVSAEVIDTAKERIGRADSNEEVLAALSDFMSNEFEVSAELGDGSEFKDREGSVKKIAKAYVDVFGALPKDFVSLAELDTVRISDNAPVSEKTGSVMGDYSPDDNEIRIFASSRIFDATINAMEKLPYVSEGTYERVIAHELGHALDEYLILPITNSDVEAQGMGTIGFIEFTARELIHRPEFTTMYAASDDEEHTAEALSGVLSKTSDGLADVDDWRRFGSESNKIMIGMLGQLEEVYPGISKLLVANRLK